MNQQQMMRLKKMQKQMMEAQEKLENSEFVGTAGGCSLKCPRQAKPTLTYSGSP